MRPLHFILIFILIELHQIPAPCLMACLSVFGSVTESGCSKAVVLFYTESASIPSHWYCGKKPQIPGNGSVILSKSNTMRVR